MEQSFGLVEISFCFACGDFGCATSLINTWKPYTMANYKGAASEAGRAMQLMKKREKAQLDIELRKKKIEEDLRIHNIENKFATHYDAVEQQLKSSTIGLVTLDEMRAKQDHIVKEREKKLAQKKLEKDKERLKEIEAKQAQKDKQKQQVSDPLIF